ncbi:MAG TPA: DUF5675 family protein [Candidatus Dojkabacteria bacterium]
MKHYLELDRIGEKPSSTIGILYWLVGKEREYECLILEDEKRAVKISGRTRIPAGTYEIKLREEPSTKTTEYRNRFDWFKWHLELQNVPGFQYIYIHFGNYANEELQKDDTEGCLLTGTAPGKDAGGEYAVWESIKAYKPFYLKVVKLLKNDRVFITIKDIY